MSWDPKTEDVRDRKDLLAMQILAPLSSTYLPWTISAMRPISVVAVLNEIVVNQRRSIVELGGGVSTHYIGRLLQRRGGHLWTVEHDELWAEVLTRELADEGLGDLVTVVHAPLSPISSPWADDDPSWYDRDTLEKAFATLAIDLLLIDGPPAFQTGKEHARYPAVPFFARKLADDYAILLDDTDRTGEQDLLDRWGSELGIAFERHLLEGVLGVGRSRPGYTI